MVIIRFLKRRDASSVVVAVALALIAANLASAFTADLASRVSGLGSSYVSDWKSVYIYPAVWALLQFIFLEMLGWLYVFVTQQTKNK